MKRITKIPDSDLVDKMSCVLCDCQDYFDNRMDFCADGGANEEMKLAVAIGDVLMKAPYYEPEKEEDGCPVCHGDCSASNPPMGSSCPMSKFRNKGV